MLKASLQRLFKRICFKAVAVLVLFEICPAPIWGGVWCTDYFLVHGWSFSGSGALDHKFLMVKRCF